MMPMRQRPPKPSALRKASGHREATVDSDESPVKKQSINSSSAGRQALGGLDAELDLDLDLQVDLAALLQRQAAASESPILNRHPGIRHSASMGNLDLSPHSKQNLGRRDGMEGFSSDSDVINERFASSDSDEDKDEDEGEADSWVGGLPREELEAMLVKANRVIKERERDLGLAAAIGKALLEKNLSLRSRHQGILAGQKNESDAGELSNSPPTTDSEYRGADQTPLASGSNASIHGYFDRAADQTVILSSQSTDNVEARSAPLTLFPPSPKTDGVILSQPVSPLGVPIASKQNRSMPHSQSSYMHLQALSADTERQLHILSDENDALVSRLAELQAEAEEQKRDGGRKLRTLDKELQSLKDELEAVMQRNAELEEQRHRLGNHGDTANSRGSAKKWRRRGPLPDQRAWNDLAGRAITSPNRDDFAPRQTSMSDLCKVAASLTPTHLSHQYRSIQQHLDAASGQPSPTRSVSVRSELSAVLSVAGSSGQGDTEHALVSQLLAKIKELEEANAAIAKAGSEMDGKLGRAIEEGERIRDAYEAVETASVMSGDVGIDERAAAGSSGDAAATAASVPAGKRRGAARPRMRRAPGNRHVIETRRTVQVAMRSERSSHELAKLTRSFTETSLAASRTSSNASASGGGGGSSSSTGSSRSGKASGYGRRRRASNLSIGKPKIHITPSMEDLRDGGREVGGGDQLGGGGAPHPRRLSDNFLQPSSAHNIIPQPPTFQLSPPFRQHEQQGQQQQQSKRDLMDDYDPSPTPSPSGSSPARRFAAFDGLSPSSSMGDIEMGVTSSMTSMASISPSLLAKLEDLQQVRQSLASEIGSVYGHEHSVEPSFDDFAKFVLPTDASRATELADLMQQAEELTQQREEQDTPPEVHDVALTSTHLSALTRRRHRTKSAPAESADDDNHSDIAALRFPEQLQASDLVAWGHGAESYLLHTLTPEDDGNWRGNEDLLPGGTFTGQHASSDGYDLLDRAASLQPVFWADDEDFGKPITLKQAQQYGLALPPPKPGKRDMLAVAVKRALGIAPPPLPSQAPKGSHRSGKGKGKGKVRDNGGGSLMSSAHLAIQSAEQLEEEEQLTRLLRRRRLDFERAVAATDPYGGSLKARHAHLSEATTKALALTPSRRRRALRQLEEEQAGHSTCGSRHAKCLQLPGSRSQLQQRAGEQSLVADTPLGESPERRFDSIRERGSRHYSLDLHPAAVIAGDDEQGGSGEVKGEEEDDFEVVDLEPSKRRPGRRGADYWPVSTRARYRPSVVKTRVEVASVEVFVWLTTWIAFASVLLCACAYAFSRGPRRILGTTTGASIQQRPN